MKYPLLIATYIVCNLSIYAQQNYHTQINKLTQHAYQHLYSQKDSAYYYFDKIHQLAKKEKDVVTQIKTLIRLNRVSVYFYDLQKTKTNLRQLDIIFDHLKPNEISQKQHRFFTRSILHNKGMYYFQIDDYKTSRTYFDRLIDILNKNKTSLSPEDKDLLSTAYSHTAKMYSHEGKYNLARSFYRKNIRFIELHHSTAQNALYNTYKHLAAVFKKEKNYISSNSYFKKALHFQIENQRGKNEILTSTHNIAQNFIALKELDSAAKYLDFMKTNLPDGHSYWRRYYHTKGNWYKAQQKDSLAIAVLDSAIVFAKQTWQDKNHLEIIESIIALADTQLEQSDYQKALENFHLAEEMLETPTAANRSKLLYVYKQRAKINNILGSKINFLNTEAITLKGLEVLDCPKPSLKDQEDKQHLLENSYALFEEGLEAVYNLYSKKQDNRFIEQAFYISEKSKILFVSKAIQKANASRFGNVPDSLLEQEKQLKSEILHLEKRLHRAPENNPYIKELLFEKQKQHRNQLNYLENNFPAYYQLKHNTQVASIESLQSYISNQQQLLSYFMGKKAIYIVSFGKIKMQFIKIPIEADCIQKIKQLYLLSSIPNKDITKWKKLSHEVYKDIVSPALRLHQNRLIIIPDGILHYIPFESLYIQENESANYLIEKASVSYAPSATLFLELQSYWYNNNNLLGIAPSFDRHMSADLLPLPHNKKELHQIHQSFKGKIFEDKQANLSNFLNHVSDFGMVHLATHAIYDDKNPEDSFLAFSKGSMLDRLYVRDLYDLQLQANLVCLSSCQCELENLKNGEGLISLVRSFFYSGTASLASSLWRVNDPSYTELLAGFYAYLAQGHDKDLALQKAKKDFLQQNQNNALSHPYYWSGLVLSGNINPILVKTSIWKYVIPLLMAFAAFLFVRHFRNP
ncbi:MAG: CHAT domain-containing protein [Flavobacteriaceae bacterium]|nr:CHAT domain-containing protein [Flavobacteriaceae bacterium]